MRAEVRIDTEIADAFEAYVKASRHADNLRRYRHVAEAEKVEATTAANEAREAWVAAEGQYKGWSRFFLVANTNGHIHRSMNCSTCNRWTVNGPSATQFRWLPTLSGLTEADAVEAHGGILCTVCFPSAPTEWTEGENKQVAAEKAARKLERERNKLPEVKKAKTKAELVSRKAYRITDLERRVARRDEELARGRDANAEYGGWIFSDGDSAEAELPKLRKQLARAEAALVELQAAADAAIAEAGL
jgi:hypothetical protein